MKAGQVTQTAESLSPMQAELLKRADDIFRSIGEAATKASEFASEQIPDIAMQYVTYGRVMCTIKAVVAVVILLVGLYLMIRVAVQDSRNLGTQRSGEWVGERFMAFVVGFFASAGGLVAVFETIGNAILVWFAPKIWLIKALTQMSTAGI